MVFGFVVAFNFSVAVCMHVYGYILQYRFFNPWFNLGVSNLFFLFLFSLSFHLFFVFVFQCRGCFKGPLKCGCIFSNLYCLLVYYCFLSTYVYFMCLCVCVCAIKFFCMCYYYFKWNFNFESCFFIRVFFFQIYVTLSVVWTHGSSASFCFQLKFCLFVGGCLCVCISQLNCLFAYLEWPGLIWLSLTFFSFYWFKIVFKIVLCP